MTVLAAIMAVGCSRETGVNITGEWKLVSVGGVPVANLGGEDDELSVYVSFGGSSFETYQKKTGGERYIRYSGTYAQDGDKVSGTYSDGQPWAASYSVAVKDGTLTMLAGNEECVYASSSIPDKVRSEAVDAVMLKSSAVRRPL